MIQPISFRPYYNCTKGTKIKNNNISFKGKEEGISLYDAKLEFEKMGVKARILPNMKLALDSYEPSKPAIRDLKVKEDDLFKHVELIDGYANFEFSKLKNTGALERVGKSVIFSQSEVEEIPNLVYVGKDAYFNNSKIKNLDCLFVGRDIHVEGCGYKPVGVLVGRYIYR